MNARRFTVGIGSYLAVLSFATAACDGGGKPSIKSFTASSSNLPLPGGLVTLTWDVKGEQSLELRPFPGAVHGTGITLELTESTDFMLVAKGNGRTDRETIHVGVGEPFAVVGRLLRPTYGPASGYGVFATGVTEPGYTDAFGNFRIEGVVAPYDLAVLDPENSATIVLYLGLTRPDPTVVAIFASTPFGGNVSGTITGVPFPTPTPPPAVATQVHTFMADGYRLNLAPNSATGAFNFGISWGNSPDSSVRITTLRSVAGADGLPASFPGYARTTEPIADGQALIVNPVLAPVGAVPLSGSIVPHDSITSASAFATVDFGSVVPQSGPLSYALSDAVDLPIGAVGTSNTFQRLVPDVAAAYALTAQGASSFGSITHTRRNLAGGATGVALDLPEPPRPLLPVQNAVVTSGTLFAVSSDDQSVNYFGVYLNGFSYLVGVLTTEDSIPLPDLSAFGIGQDSIYDGYVYYQTYGPYDSMDDAAGPTALVPVGDDSYTGSSFEPRTFTVAPIQN